LFVTEPNVPLPVLVAASPNVTSVSPVTGLPVPSSAVRVTVVVLPEARLPPSAVEVTVELVASMTPAWSDVIENVLDAAFALPAASVTRLAATDTVIVPAAVGVTSNVYVVALVDVKPVMVPSVTVTSEETNLFTASLNVTVIGIDESLVGLVAVEVIVGVGVVVSYPVPTGR
jgi:hypothetical protein